MKKIFSLLAILALVFVMAACSKTNEPAKDEEKNRR